MKCQELFSICIIMDYTYFQGYWKKKCRLFDSVITEDVKKKVEDTEKLLKEDSITEVKRIFAV